MTGGGFREVPVAYLLCPSGKGVSSTFLPLLGPQTIGGWGVFGLIGFCPPQCDEEVCSR